MSRLPAFRFLIVLIFIFFTLINLSAQETAQADDTREQYLIANDLIASFQFEEAQKS